MLSLQVLIVSLSIPFIEYYSFVAVKQVSRDFRKNTRAVVFTGYIILSLAVLFSLFTFRRWAATEWPSVFTKTMVNLLIGVFFGKFVIAAIMLAGDLLIIVKSISILLFSIPDRIKGKPVSGNKMSRSRFISLSALAAGTFFTGSLAYGMSNRYRYKLRYVPVSIPGLPKELQNLRIVQISDIHTGSFDNPEAVNEGIEMALNAKPDLILFTGDLVNYRSEEAEPYLEYFKRLHAPLGVYSVLGNHDYSDYLQWPTAEAKKKDFEQLKSHHQTLGWRLLMNENVLLMHKGVEFSVIGSENWSTRHRFTKYGDLKKAMSGIEGSELPLKILMSHDPTHWDAQIRPDYPDVNLTLSGHTHGMQLGVDIPGLKWSPAQYIYRQWAGLYREANQYLYVNRGFGFIGYNGRLGIMPEIALIELL